MSLDEKSALRTVFISDRKEAGINTVYDPILDREFFQVFIHNDFPYKNIQEWEFDDFPKARSFAATHFNGPWEVLTWDGKINRKCDRDDCGERKDCEECKNGGGCKTCGATDDLVL